MNKKYLIKKLTRKLLDKKIILSGFIVKIRTMKTKTFIDIRDSSGILQIVVLDTKLKFFIGNVVEIQGKLKEYFNSKNILQFELEAEEINLLNSIPEEEWTFLSEESKMLFRLPYIKQQLYKNLHIKSEFIKFTTNFFTKHYFTMVHTPILGSDKSTSGANVFSTKSKENEYFLSQSPQIFKQTLVCSGVIRYFQFAPCFRNEDSRLDRQLEFLQLDLEAAFENKQFFISLAKKFLSSFFKPFLVEQDKKFKWNSISYNKSMHDYGTDSPIMYKNIKLLKDQNQEYFWKDDYNQLFLSNNHIVKFIDGCYFTNSTNLTQSGVYLKNYLRSVVKNEISCVVVNKFPLFEWNEEANKYEATHHPFCKSVDGKFSEQFDLVMNGYEIAGGSERISDKINQMKVLENLKQDIQLPLFNFSVPKHSGCAFGIERLLAAFFNSTSIREWIAFPKTGQGKCLTFEKNNSSSIKYVWEQIEGNRESEK